jgi:hypothetical protein
MAALTVAGVLAPAGAAAKWIAGSFWGAALLATCASLAIQLPLAQIMSAGIVAAILGGLSHAVNGVIGLPFGNGAWPAVPPPKLWGLVPAVVPIIWTVAALNARGAARVLLHSRRAHPHHGYRVIALATLLTTLFGYGFATAGATDGRSPGAWIFLLTGWSVISLLIQTLMTPLLIDKFPQTRPVNAMPLWVWCALSLRFAGMLLRHNEWAPAAVMAAGALFAIGSLPGRR